MTLKTKRNVVCVILAVVCLWPLGHHALVRTLGLNPWKWFGWAMYTVPPARVRANAFNADTGAPLDIGVLTRDEGKKVLAAYLTFSNRRMEFGRKVEPVDFARACFRAFPRAQRVMIDVQDVRLDRATAMIAEVGRAEYTYERAEALD